MHVSELPTLEASNTEMVITARDVAKGTRVELGDLRVPWICNLFIHFIHLFTQKMHAECLLHYMLCSHWEMVGSCTNPMHNIVM